jgi:hypothetical protein
MLEGLDDIDWSKLGHAYGPASDVPDLLRSLASADEDSRHEAVNELYGNIWHQGTVYEASSYAVPFLIELLGSQEVECKDEILLLLAHLALGTSYHKAHQHLPSQTPREQGADWQKTIEREIGWVDRVKSAVRAGEDVYLKFLQDEEPLLRDSAAYLLASLERPAPRLADSIWRRIDREESEHIQVSLLLAFGFLAEPNEANRGSLLEKLVNTPSDSIRLAAAMSLVNFAAPPQEVILLLIDAVQSPEKYRVFAKSVWARINELENLVLDHFARLDADSALAAETTLVKNLMRGEHLEALRIAEVLLTLAFSTTLPRNSKFGSLTEKQQRAVKIIAETHSVWFERRGRDETQSVRASSLLRSCGLPDEQGKLLAFIGHSSNANR